MEKATWYTAYYGIIAGVISVAMALVKLV